MENGTLDIVVEREMENRILACPLTLLTLPMSALDRGVLLLVHGGPLQAPVLSLELPSNVGDAPAVLIHVQIFKVVQKKCGRSFNNHIQGICKM